MDLKAYKKEFVGHLMNRGYDKGWANTEVDAHIENMGIENLTDPVKDADECMSYYYEENDMGTWDKD